MTQKDVNDLCVVVSLYVQCHCLSEFMDDLNGDVPDDISDAFCQLSESVQQMLSAVEDYRENAQHVFIDACSDKGGDK